MAKKAKYDKNSASGRYCWGSDSSDITGIAGTADFAEDNEIADFAEDVKLAENAENADIVEIDKVAIIAEV